MKKKKNAGYDFSEETIEQKRKFPILQTVLLCFLIFAQIVCLFVILFYEPKPQDIIDNYTVYVAPKDDGSLDIEYHFTWTALDMSDPLTWVEIGMANEYFSILDDHSDNIRYVERYTDDEGYCSAQIHFVQPYVGGETVEFSFKINQRRMLATDGVELFYEFVPGWFNYTQVSHYTFYFQKYGDIGSYNGDRQDNNYLIWEGSLDYGEGVLMRVNYNEFDAHAVKHDRFSYDGLYNGLEADKTALTVVMIFLMIVGLVLELLIVDAYVSYANGRGFLRGYGHPVHIYGYTNPRYRDEVNKRSGSGGGGRGGGCACACACACAGGGRAGCSQKDTYRVKRK